MKIAVISVYVDYNRKGEHHRGILQPQIGPLVAALLPPEAEVEVVNDTWDEPDWTRDYDLVFISCLHSDFDRARQISHYWRRRGAKTVFGGMMASLHAHLCLPFFDAIVIGDAEGAVGEVYDDFRKGALKRMYVSGAYDGRRVPMPRFDLLANRQVLPLSLEATRGCPFTCDFCMLTGVGTRYHVRPIDLVLEDIRRGRELLRGRVADFRLGIVAFVDNNLGGSPSYLARLCDALGPLGLRWGAAVTFNCVADPDLVKRMSRAGCRFVFVGLESFNPAAIAGMGKHQNVIDQTLGVLDHCRRHGILVLSGLMLSPAIDDFEYIRSVPARLAEAGLHVPTFVSFACPIPGTPQFNRLASRPKPAFLPGAFLRDFAGYTLVEQPQHATAGEFIGEYRAVLDVTFSRRAKLRKLVDDLPPLLRGGYWDTALVDVLHQSAVYRPPHPDRTYLAGSDVPPPEMTSVPLVEGDFDSEAEYRAVMEPWRVTDATGRVLPEWIQSTRVFDRSGQLSRQAMQLAGMTA